METQQTQNVRAEINALEVGDVAMFPIARYEYVLSCRTKLAKATGRAFKSTSVSLDKTKDSVFIKRTL